MGGLRHFWENFFVMFLKISATKLLSKILYLQTQQTGCFLQCSYIFLCNYRYQWDLLVTMVGKLWLITDSELMSMTTPKNESFTTSPELNSAQNLKQIAASSAQQTTVIIIISFIMFCLLLMFPGCCQSVYLHSYKTHL